MVLNLAVVRSEMKSARAGNFLVLVGDSEVGVVQHQQVIPVCVVAMAYRMVTNKNALPVIVVMSSAVQLVWNIVFKTTKPLASVVLYSCRGVWLLRSWG